MKKLIIILLATASGNKVFAQCPLDTINTDPNPAYVQPPNNGHQPPFHTNTFEWWMNPVTPINKPSTDIPTTVTSPYNLADNNSAPSLQFINQNPNPGTIRNFLPGYKPQDGWQLIKQDMGWYYDASANPTQPWAGGDLSTGACVNEKVVYILLYNIYETKLRLFGILPNQSGGMVQVNLSFVPEGTVSADNLSGLFNQFNYPAEQSLDQLTITKEISSVAILPDEPNNWFFVDFPMAYDPCTCFFQSEIQADFRFLTSGVVTATGASLGLTGLYNLLHTFDLPNYPFDTNQVFSFTAPSVMQFNTIIQEYNSALNFAESASANGYDAGSAAGMLSSLKTVSAALTASSGSDQSWLLELIAAQAGDLSDIVDLFSMDQNDFPFVTSNQLVITPSLAIDSIDSSAIFVTANPGSLNASADPEYVTLTNPYCAGSYTLTGTANCPIYNNPMGLFALLKQDTVNQTLIANEGTFSSIYDTSGPIGFVTGATFGFQYQLSNNSIQYSFNPIVDTSKTKIFAALEIEGMPNQPGYSEISAQNLVFKDSGQTNSGPLIRHRTHFFPLECLSSIITDDSFAYSGLSENTAYNDLLAGTLNVNVNIIFSIGFVFQPDPYNLVHTSVQTFKYPLVIKNVGEGPTTLLDEINSIIPLPENLAINTETMGTGFVADTIFSYGTITIDGNITTYDSTKQYYIIAEQAIVVTPGSTIAPNISLQISAVPTNICTQPSTSPTAVDYTYCNSSSYQANQPAGLSASTAPLIPHLLSPGGIFNTFIYPNPTNDEFTVNISGIEDGIIDIDIYDELGNHAYRQETTSYGQNQGKYDIANLNLAAGLYMVKITNGSNMQSHPLVIAKQ